MYSVQLYNGSRESVCPLITKIMSVGIVDIKVLLFVGVEVLGAAMSAELNTNKIVSN